MANTYSVFNERHEDENNSGKEMLTLSNSKVNRQVILYT
jgi:hypothetical protein